MSRPDIENLLDRYSKQQTTPEENLQVEQWLDGHATESGRWQGMNASTRGQWLDSLFEDVQQSIGKGRSAKVILLQQKQTWLRAMIAIAACIVIFFVLYAVLPSVRGWFLPSKLMVIQALPSQKRQLTLSDGTQVWLNAGAIFQYAQTFSGKTREVYLTGEAYFDVKHNSAKPFIVHTGQVITTVLGTAFNIKAGKGTAQVVVTVTRGKVSVADGSHLLGYLTPNEQISYNTEQQKLLKTTVNAPSIIAWSYNDLQFDDLTFSEAAQKLEQRFGVKIHFANESLKNCRFSGTAPRGKNLDKVLQIICAFNHANFQHEGDGSILISGEGCNQ